MMMSVSKLLSFAALFFFVLFSFINLSWCTGNSTITCPEIEKHSLLNFKQSLQVVEYSLSSWSDEVDCCNWKGVRCSNITGHVDQLSLQAGNSGGQICPSLLNLKYLKYLDLASDYRSSLRVDSIEWLSGLSKLEYLSISGVNLSRASNWQQQVINKLPSLVELHVHRCNLNNTDLLREVNNIAASNLTILDLSFLYSVGEDDSEDDSISSAGIVPRWIFHLINLTYLDLSGNYYEGPIPSVCNSTKLRHIDLSSSRFNSSIPEWLYALKDLEFLDLSGNNLQGAISNSILNLTSLNTLYLDGNHLSGKLPRGITNLCKLQRLHLGDINLQGEISDLFGNISDCSSRALEYLNLGYNKISGHLIHQFGEFKNLQVLDLSRNSLSGVIPSNLGNLSFLQHLVLRDNKLTGNLPETIGQLSNLRELSIGNNMLQGTVTETHFANLSGLKTLWASGNQLTLKVSPNWIPPFEIYGLELGSWNLGSRFPSWLDTQEIWLEYLDLSNTGIYGNVPNWIWSVEQVDLSHNQLHGQLPRISTTSAYFLDLSNNLFSGDLSHFLCNTTTNYALQTLNLGGNHLTGKLPNCFIKWPALLMLNLSNNNLSGRIPDSIGFLTRLQSLSLCGNNFSGNIPSSIHTCTELMNLDLSYNNLFGNLPKRIMTTLSNLAILNVKSNKLSGEIISTICQLSSLHIIDLSDNTFSGKIPRCVDNFTAMITGTFDDYFYNNGIFTESASIATKGMELTYDTILEFVTCIDLSRNNLSGDIPEQITSLVQLGTLNLSGNRLTGRIPDTIGNMKNLESLDFSVNSLSGELPNSFTAMSYLEYLNVSYNRLTGRIPECTQLRGFKESSFVGNNLCGPPLPRCEAPGTMHPEDGGSVKPEIEWLYVFTSLGFAVGLSATLTTLFLKISWREAYFEFVQSILDNAYVYAFVKWRKLKSGLSLNM